MRARLADEGGFTIVEVLTAMVVGLIVLGAAFVLVGRASALQATTQNRVDAHQRGRAGLEAMVSALRSGTCAMTADEPRTRRSSPATARRSSSTRTPPARTPCRSAAS